MLHLCSTILNSCLAKKTYLIRLNSLANPVKFTKRIKFFVAHNLLGKICSLSQMVTFLGQEPKLVYHNFSIVPSPIRILKHLKIHSKFTRSKPN